MLKKFLEAGITIMYDEIAKTRPKTHDLINTGIKMQKEINTLKEDKKEQENMVNLIIKEIEEHNKLFMAGRDVEYWENIAKNWRQNERNSDNN